jgi:hypothetical protein
VGFYFLLVERSDIPLSLGQKGGSQEAQPPGRGLRQRRREFPEAARLDFVSCFARSSASAETKVCTSIYLKSLTMASLHVSAHISKTVGRFLIIQQMNII